MTFSKGGTKRKPSNFITYQNFKQQMIVCWATAQVQTMNPQNGILFNISGDLRLYMRFLPPLSQSLSHISLKSPSKGYLN